MNELAREDRRSTRTRAIGAAVGLLLLAGTITACGGDSEEPIIFSGSGQVVPDSSE